MSLYVAGLWRYPVKTLAGERLPMTTLTADGMPFDRIVQVHGPEGVRTSRRHYRLLGLRGTLGEHGRPLINGHPWDSPEALALVKQAEGDDAWLEAYDGPERFDVLPVVRLDSLRGRCPMTTVDPDTLERNPDVLPDIGRRFGGRLALNAEVAHAGEVRVGDPVTLTRSTGGEGAG